MKSLLIASLVLTPLIACPASAASLEDHPSASQHRFGTFAGARLRMAVGGDQAARPRLGLAITGINYRRSADGSMRTRFAEGAEYGVSSAQGLGWSLAGRSTRAGENKLNASSGGGISPNLIFGAGVGLIVIGAAIGVIDAVGDD